MKLCSTTGKVVYKRIAVAKSAIARQTKEACGCYDAPRYPYRCGFCRKYHTTKQEPRH